MATYRHPPISIVMPVFNGADLLPATVRSILDQSYGDFELIIVDDGGTDNTEDIVREMQRTDERLRFYRLEENTGMAYARNVGLELAKGGYIALADQDDLWLPGKLARQMEVIGQWPDFDILFTDWLNIDHTRQTEGRGFDENKKGMKYLEKREISNGLYVVDSGVEIGILRANFIQPATLVLRKDVFLKVGVFDNSLRGAPDLEFGWRVAALGGRYAYLDDVLLERHKYHSGVSAQTVYTNTEVVKALQRCSQLCQKLHRPELDKLIGAAQHQAWMRLISYYASEGRRAEIWGAYKQSTKCGFSLRVLAFLLLGLGGRQLLPSSLGLWARITQGLES